MFIRCRPNAAKTKWTVMVCKSTRKGEKVSQEIVKYLGVAHNEKERKALERLGQSEIRSLTTLPEYAEDVLSTKNECDGVLLGDVVETKRVLEGPHDVFGKFFDLINLQDLFEPQQYERLKDVVVCRIASPASKRQTAKLLSQEYDRATSKESIYRLMDKLTCHQEEIQTRIFNTTKNLSEKQVIDVLFFDVTTLYYESQQNDEIRDFGYSKDHKIGEVQVVLALATTSKGLPLGYMLFPGKTAEVTTLLQCLEAWKKNFEIQNVVVVADRAMMSETNLQAMENSQLKYVIAAKLKRMNASFQRKILSRATEQRTSVNNEPMAIQEHIENGRRFIISYSESRAIKDRGDRERLLLNIKKKMSANGMIKEKQLITNRGYSKYCKEQTAGAVIFDEKKVEEEARWDGLHGVVTNDTETAAEKLLERYRGLWVIEESFRINKHTLEMRPIYHFTPRRIRAHMLLCFIAYSVTRYAQHQISAFVGPISVERLREELGQVECSILEDTITGRYYKMPSEMSKEAKAIYKAVGLQRSNSPHRIKTAKKCSGRPKI
jgi:transposase